MNCDKQALVAYHYDDIDKTERSRFEAHLQHCAECRRELEELAGTSRILAAWSDEDPQLNLRFAGAQPVRRFTWPSWLRGRWAAGLGAALAVWFFESGWTDILIAIALLAVFSRSTFRVLTRALRELNPAAT